MTELVPLILMAFLLCDWIQFNIVANGFATGSKITCTLWTFNCLYIFNFIDDGCLLV